MGRSLNRDNDAPVSTPERRSLRHSKPPEEEGKPNLAVKGRRSVGKKKEEKVENKTEEISQTNVEDVSEKIQKSTSAADGGASNSKSSISESSNSKPASLRSGRASRKRQLSETDDTEGEEKSNEKSDDKADDKSNNKSDNKLDDKSDDKPDEKSDDKADDKTDDKLDDKSDDKEDEKDDQDNSDLKNGKERAPKSKAKKKRKPPTKKKKEVQDESELWTPLEPLDGDVEKKETQKKALLKSDRRKQALVERQAPAEPMLQKQLPRQRRNSDTSECEVLVSVPRHHRRSKTIVTVDIDDEASETGSIQIVAEPDVDSVFDFKRLLIQYRNVNLPSSLWGVHKDPRNQFVSFTRFNPDYPETNGLIIDRAVAFKGSLHPEAFVNGEKMELPEMFNVVETIFEAAQVIQFVNNPIVPVNQPPSESTDAAC